MWVWFPAGFYFQLPLLLRIMSYDIPLETAKGNSRHEQCICCEGPGHFTKGCFSYVLMHQHVKVHTRAV